MFQGYNIQMVERNQSGVVEGIRSAARIAKEIQSFHLKGKKLEQAQGIVKGLGLSEEETGYVHAIIGYRLLRNETFRLMPLIDEDLADIEVSMNKRKPDSLLNKYFYKPVKESKELAREELKLTVLLFDVKLKSERQEIAENMGEERADMIGRALHDVLTLYFDIQERGVTSNYEKQEAIDDMNSKLNFWRDSLENNRNEKP